MNFISIISALISIISALISIVAAYLAIKNSKKRDCIEEIQRARHGIYNVLNYGNDSRFYSRLAVATKILTNQCAKLNIQKYNANARPYYNSLEHNIKKLDNLREYYKFGTLIDDKTYNDLLTIIGSIINNLDNIYAELNK